ncbi:hypothetical protein HR12_36200 [Microbacterium sp. SUBG005]|nr:hypothetical protein HR12_36200 [Microbacterium sp. SUBG005]
MKDDAAFRKKAVSGAGWVAADKWSNRLTSLVILTVLGRLLTPADFGVVAIATAFLAFVAVFADQGFARALVQRSELPNVYPTTSFWVSLGSSLVLGTLVALTAPFVSAIFNGGDTLTQVIQLSSIALVLNAIASTPAALLERNFDFRALAIRRFSGTVTGGVAAVIAAFAGLGVWSLVLQTLVTATVSLVTLWLASSWRPSLSFSLTALRHLWGVGSSIIGMELVSLVNSQADRLLIGAALSPEAVGYYYLAIRVVAIMVDLFSAVFSGASLTTFSRLQNDRPRLLAWFYKLTSMSSTTAIPIFALALVTAPVMIPFIFGSQWGPSVILFQVLSLLGALNAVAYFDRSVLIAIGKAKAAFLLTLGQAVLGVVLVVVAVPWGVMAVAIAVTTRQYLYWPMRLVTLKRNVGVSPTKYLGQWLRPFLTSVVAIIPSVVLTVAWPDFASSAPIGFVALNVALVSLIYGLGVWLLNRDYFHDVRRIVQRKF